MTSKKPAVKASVDRNRPFGPVTVTTGPMAGMVFSVDDHTSVNDGKVKVKYIAPGNGPRAIVEHMQVRGEFDPARKAEDVRLAFAKLLPGTVLFDKENGYSERKSGKLLEWDRQLARFVSRRAESTPISAPAITTTEKDGED
jgi:hypothetical protein